MTAPRVRNVEGAARATLACIDEADRIKMTMPQTDPVVKVTAKHKTFLIRGALRRFAADAAIVTAWGGARSFLPGRRKMVLAPAMENQP